MGLIFRGGTIVCGDEKHQTFEGCDLVVRDGRIVAIERADRPAPEGYELVDVRGKVLIPGFVQAHVHLVQTLFRGLADDLALLDWLRTRIWPLERAHDEESTYWSARLGLTEMLLAGTTGILDMATVRHTDAVFRAAAEVGLHAHIGNAMMDQDNEAGLGASLDANLEEAERLRSTWHGRGNLRFAYAPRFVPSCSDDLLRQTARLARTHGCMVHSHASENRDEVRLVHELTGRRNIVHLHHLGLTGKHVALAHCIHLTEEEERILAETETTVVHCPGSNAKLASGLCRVPELRARGIRCALGADGSPCNNRLDPFAEMRLAALLQKPRLGAETMPARDALHMATAAGARALGIDAGELVVGRQADFIVLDPDLPHSLGGGPPDSAVVYAMTPANVRAVYLGGRRVVSDGAVVGWDTGETVREAKKALTRVRARANL
ncbi:MAG: amidohydrolase family protein [Myxococcota bacterium]